MKNKLSYFKTDIQAGLVVFLVALPLCLGIALASGADPLAGIISGVIGGIVVGFISGSQLSVTGPAAGLTAIVGAAIISLGSYETFLMAVVLAGAIQLVMGLVKAGTISNYFPSNVIEGMLMAIGITIILTQLPHAIGYDVAHEGDFFQFETAFTHGLISDLVDAVNFSHLGAVIVTCVSLAILISYNQIKQLQKLKVVPPALVAVLAGVALNEFFKASNSSLAISSEHLVNLPIPDSFDGFLGQFSMPNWSSFTNPDVWIVAVTIAVVASIETLLCIEASDKLDPLKRFTNSNRELFAQGTGNILSGLIGGIPMTSVIVRTSANINSGGRTKTSTIAHGILLLLAVVSIPFLLNKIPLASLAAVLLMIGYKLASPKIVKHMFKLGWYQFIPFAVTVLATVILKDLLKGVTIGLVVSVFFILRANLKMAYFFKKEEHKSGAKITIKLAQEVSFLNKAAIKQTLYHIPENSSVILDATDTFYIDHDVLQTIKDFLNIVAVDKEITVELIGFKDSYLMESSLKHVTSK